VFLPAILTVLDIGSAGIGVVGLWCVANPTLID
jgi:hypothetical protein